MSTKLPDNCKTCPAWRKSVFHGLSDEKLKFVAEAKTCRVYSKEEKFSQKDAPANEVYCIASGAVKVSLPSGSGGKESIVRLVPQGGLLGYRCIFSEKVYRATATALMDTVACRFDKSAIFQLLEVDFKFSMEVFKRMGQEIASAENHHHSFCQRSSRERIAEALLILGSRFGTPVDAGVRVDLLLTRTEFSAWVGVAKETAIRCLSDFKEEGLISQQEKEEMILLDLNKLSLVASVPALS